MQCDNERGHGEQLNIFLIHHDFHSMRIE